MTSAKEIILTAIYFQGVASVKANATKMADDCLCSVQHVLRIVRQVETGKILIRN